MDDESQLTLAESVDNSVPRDLQSAVSALADTLVAADRERAGDNCATVSQRHTDTDGEFIFCIQLPPRTNSVSMETFTDLEHSTLTVEFVESSVRLSTTPEEVIWRFSGSHPDADTLQLLLVKPVESVQESGEDDDEHNRDAYRQFDFTEFVHISEE